MLVITKILIPRRRHADSLRQVQLTSSHNEQAQFDMQQELNLLPPTLK